MGLLKAFVCQVVILGSYKLFIEQAIEEYLPDEVARNCLIGSICLLCFGIQLYTDKPGDDESAEADEIPKSKSEKTTDANKFASREVVTEKKMPPNDQQFVDSKEWSRMQLEAEKVTEVRHAGIFVQSSSNISCTLSNVGKSGGMGKPEATTHASYWQETTMTTSTTTTVLNGFTETNVHEESEEDDIEIDQFVHKKSTKEVKPIKSKDVAKEDEPINAENATEEAKKPLKTVEAEQVEPINTQNATEESKPLKTIGTEQAELAKSKDEREAVVESECSLANGDGISPARDSDQTTTLKISGSSKTEMTNGLPVEPLNSISNIVKSSESVKELGDIKNAKEIILSPEPDDQGNITESTTFGQEVSIASSTSTAAVVNYVETASKNIADTSTLAKATISSPSENVLLSTARQNSATIIDVCVAPVTVDISFIYACH